jgi:hypothetical protein
MLGHQRVDDHCAHCHRSWFEILRLCRDGFWSGVWEVRNRHELVAFGEQEQRRVLAEK